MVERHRGTVVPGRGDLARWMRRYHAAYEQLTGVTLVPGSLNLELATAWRRPEPPPLRLDADQVGVGVGLVPCRIEAIDGWILRTDRNEAGTGHHPRTIIEVIAAVHLRDTLDLEDGDQVEVLILDATGRQEA